MTPDQLISFLALLVEEVCQSAVKMRVADKHISAEEWLALDDRWRLLRQANLVECFRRDEYEDARATSINPAER